MPLPSRFRLARGGRKGAERHALPKAAQRREQIVDKHPQPTSNKARCGLGFDLALRAPLPFAQNRNKDRPLRWHRVSKSQPETLARSHSERRASVNESRSRKSRAPIEVGINPVARIPAPKPSIHRIADRGSTISERGHSCPHRRVQSEPSRRSGQECPRFGERQDVSVCRSQP